MAYEWVILDTETTGINAPIHVVEIAAQKMIDTEADGEPFSCLINHDIPIPEAASRIHGYTRDLLERDGLLPAKAYEQLANFIGDRHVVAYNLPYDWDDVLVKEWERLGIEEIGRRGFCALRLVRRLLDPVPAGNCKLQTLRRYYELPERAAHSAKGDVLTVLDLFENVLFPIAREVKLENLSEISAYAEEEWYPSKIAFGKHKGRDFRDAKSDPDLKSYLGWLAGSQNPRSSALGNWYLNNLDKAPNEVPFFSFDPSDDEDVENNTSGLVVWSDPEVERLSQLVSAGRRRLADAETEYVILKSKIDQTRSIIFKALRPFYEKQDIIRLKIQYRQTFLDSLIREGEDNFETFEDEFKQAEKEKREEYEKTQSELSSKKELSEEEQARLSKTWKKLVSVFHPDRHQNNEDKRKRYEELTAIINLAKEEGDLDTLEEIASDPEAYASKKGLGSLDFSDKNEVDSMRRLWQALEAEILSVYEAIEALKNSSEYELATLSEKNDEFLEEVIEQKKAKLQDEVEELEITLAKLGEEIAELTGETFLD